MGLFRRIVRRIFGSLFLALVTFVGAPLTAGAVVLSSLIFLPLPATIPLAKANPVVEPTTIYDAEGQKIATLSEGDENVPVTASQIPAILKEAVIASEDRDFYHEGGVDLKGIIRAFVADLENDKIVQGGSTITEQYVKLAYTNGKRSLLTKAREAVLASQLDRAASKNEILYRYLTTVYFGDGNYGVGAAAENYFHVSVSKLTPSEAATLSGLIPAPSDRAPRENPAAAETFRELVLKEMLHQGYLRPGQYRRALRQRLFLVGSGKAPADATLVYPPPTTQTAYPSFVSYVKDWLDQHYGSKRVLAGGLRVQTTLDPTIQNEAQNAVDNTLSGTSDPLEMGLAAIQPQTGFIEAMVGHKEGTTTYADDNFAIAGCTLPPKGVKGTVEPTCATKRQIVGGAGGYGRQPGSSWKLFSLATAFKHGIPPTKVYQAPEIYQIPGCVVLAGQPASSCQITNDEGSVEPEETLSYATAQSTNTVYAQVAEQDGCANVAKTAKSMGVTTAYWSTKVFPYCASFALGEEGVSPLEMASAYGVVADHGLLAAPTPILEIVAPSGKILVNNIKHPPKTKRVLSANIANNITSVLEGVIEDGTGTAAALGRPAAGKTGTTSNEDDAWFDGYTPTLATSVWMGNANSESPLGVVKGVYPVDGGTWPAITWHNFMEQALANVPVTNFSAPAPITPPKQLVTTPTTQAPVTPGYPTSTSGTPSGGPYQGAVPTPVAEPPATLPTTPSTDVTGPTGTTGDSGTGSSTTTTSTSTTTTTIPATTTTTVGGVFGGL